MTRAYVDGHQLASALKRASLAACSDASLHHLCCVLVESGHLVATDGHRLHAVTLDIFDDDDHEPWSIPGAMATALISLATSCNSRALVRPHERSITIAGTEVRVMESPDFPPWRAVVPSSPPSTITIPRRDLLRELRELRKESMRVMRALKAAKMPWLSHVVRLQLGTESLHLELSNRAPSDTEYARRTVALTADAATDATISVSLSLDYLIDAMRACVSDTVSIGATGALDPVKVTGGDAVCVVMPCRA